jgi:hypothetical protein
MTYSNTRGINMLPVPKDEQFEVDASGWNFEASTQYNEAESDSEIVAENPSAFDYSEFSENRDDASGKITGTVTPIAK